MKFRKNKLWQDEGWYFVLTLKTKEYRLYVFKFRKHSSVPFEFQVRQVPQFMFTPDGQGWFAWPKVYPERRR